MTKARRRSGPVRFAVVGLGYISQIAVLPAFATARGCELNALVSSDGKKLRALGRKYGVERLFSYAKYEECLRSGEVDAVFIAVPNDRHAEFAIRAARAGVHVLCEKPMAVTEAQCTGMIAAAEEAGVKLMIGYRLHLERANLTAIELVRSGKVGLPRLFTSEFTMQVRDRDNIRLRGAGGGPLWDIGIYCINAARYLFRSEPFEVAAWVESIDEPRFRECDEMAAVTMRFPGERLASFVCSFGAADVSSYRVIGTKGDLRVDRAFEYAEEIVHHLTVEGKTTERSFAKRDQFAAELEHFAKSIRRGDSLAASGRDALADVRILRALERSRSTGRPIRLKPFDPGRRPTLADELQRPAHGKPSLVRAVPPGARR
jgi:predicted dehydrogenase